MNKTLPPPPPSTPPSISSPSFDQIVKGNVTIKKLSKYRYRITFSKIGKFLQYQVWDKDNVNNINDKRFIFYNSATQWVKSFKEYNTYLNENNKPLFTPTTIMETDNDKKFAFIIQKACFNSCDQVVFTVSTNEISSSSTKLTRLPIGKLHNVRFDIDEDSFRDYQARVIKNKIPDGTQDDLGNGTRLCWRLSQLSDDSFFSDGPLTLYLFSGVISFYTDPYMNIKINDYTKEKFGKESGKMLYYNDYGYWCEVCRQDRHPAN